MQLKLSEGLHYHDGQTVGSVGLSRCVCVFMSVCVMCV